MNFWKPVFCVLNIYLVVGEKRWQKREFEKWTKGKQSVCMILPLADWWCFYLSMYWCSSKCAVVVAAFCSASPVAHSQRFCITTFWHWNILCVRPKTKNNAKPFKTMKLVLNNDFPKLFLMDASGTIILWL